MVRRGEARGAPPPTSVTVPLVGWNGVNRAVVGEPAGECVRSKSSARRWCSRNAAGQPVQIVFEVRVFVAVRVAIAVGEIAGGRIGVQSLDRFPPVGQTVVVGVPIRRARDGAIILPAAHVVLRVRQAGEPPYGLPV